MSDTNSFKNHVSLLEQISITQRKYEEIAKVTGENFNVFNLLGLSTKEVRLHSKLIAELLNPDGTHGLKDVFLKLFLEALINKSTTEKDKDFLISFNTENVKVQIEKWTGYIDKNYDSGGYIDIVIESKQHGGKSIIIENKIHAGDQRGQLRRYYKFNKNSLLVYLTLEGKGADIFSTKNNEYPNELISPLSISYRGDILEWLNHCKKEAVNYPLVRETITQYTYLIKHLTHQTMNENMKNELVKIIINNPDLIKSASEINSVWEECKFQIIDNLIESIEEIAKEIGLENDIDKSDGRLGDKETGFWFYRKNWNYCIYFYFERRLEVLHVGIDATSKETKVVMDADGTTNKLSEFFHDFEINNQLTDKSWIWAVNFDEWDNTSWDVIQNKIPDAIKQKTQLILNKLDQFQP